MDVFPYVVVGAVTGALAGSITLVGNRTRRAVGRGVSLAGLVLGALLGGALIALFDLLLAFVLTLLWGRVIVAQGGPPITLLMAFIGIAVVHVWATTALSWRRWQADPVMIDRDRVP